MLLLPLVGEWQVTKSPLRLQLTSPLTLTSPRGAYSSVSPAAGSFCQASIKSSPLAVIDVGTPAMRRANGRGRKFARGMPLSSTMLKSSRFQPSLLAGVQSGV
jgi:hypothetical protein